MAHAPVALSMAVLLSVPTATAAAPASAAPVTRPRLGVLVKHQLLFDASADPRYRAVALKAPFRVLATDTVKLGQIRPCPATDEVCKRDLGTDANGYRWAPAD